MLLVKTCNCGVFILKKNSGLRLAAAISQIYAVDLGTKVVRPLFSCRVSAGFPSPAEDYIERQLDLNELLIPHPAATFFVRVSGESMTGAGINHGDILIVDRSLEPGNGKIVIAVLNGELTVKQLAVNGAAYRLLAANAAYKPIEIREEMSFEVWGVVTSVIHQFN